VTPDAPPASLRRGAVRAGSSGPGFRIEAARDETGWAGLRFSGQLRFGDAGQIWAEAQRLWREHPPTEVLNLDLSHVDHVDGGAMALLVDMRASLVDRGIRCELVGAQGRVAQILELYGGADPPAKRPKPRPSGLLDQVGRGTIGAFKEVRDVFGFVGTMVLAIFGVIRHPGTANWRDVPYTMARTGADAVPIILLINFLLGFVMAFQSAAQLKQFGANIYVADLVGLSVTRELGPLMTAIVVCGRSGAAFAAELATMRVSEEVDALRTLGMGPIRYLVFPRLIGLVLVMPILALLADVIAIVGGLLVGILSLDLTFASYLTETRNAVHLWDVGQGLLKSIVFAVAIALISCQQGLAASGGAEGVGKRTTASVVTILFALILTDAFFTLVFHYFGI
jgi:phospholipid/cholesterol/gamma-HCH transport system permease protein